MRSLFIPNTDFDLQLRHEQITPKIARAVQEMSTLFLPALPAQWEILSPLSVESSYVSYLHSKGLTSATLSPTIEGADNYDAWGWLEQVDSSEHPAQEIIKKVNSRQFSYDLRATLSTALPDSSILEATSPIPPWVHENCEWVAKPLYGNAGAGFLQGIGSISLQESLAMHPKTTYVCEPWLERITDIATRLIIAQEGTITLAGHHRNISNRSGSFYANLCAPQDPEIEAWKHSLDTQAHIIGKALVRAGYWGVVGIDSFTYEGPHGTELAGGFDINARHTISTLTYGVYQQLNRESCFMYRFMAKRRLALPDTYTALEELLGDLSYSKQKGEGVVLLSPLLIINNKASAPPLRSAFGIIAATIERVFELDEQFRVKVLKKK